MRLAPSLAMPALALALFAGSAAPAPSPSPRLNISDLDLASPADKVRLDRRLRRAALQTCGVHQGSRLPSAQNQHRRCVREPLERAYRDIAPDKQLGRSPATDGQTPASGSEASRTRGS